MLKSVLPLQPLDPFGAEGAMGKWDSSSSLFREGSSQFLVLGIAAPRDPFGKWAAISWWLNANWSHRLRSRY